MVLEIKKELRELGYPKKAKISARFFKTGKGEYGEGDIFLGIKVPDQRKVAKKYTYLKLEGLQKLLQSKIHEERLVALLILVNKYQKAEEGLKREIYKFYLKNSRYINNWDLVDLSAPKIVGAYLLDKPKERKVLYKLAKSLDLWERRISILATYTFIRNKQLKDTLKIAQILLGDKHDLIHKAAGWMLRELGKVDQKKEEEFLQKHYRVMPRVMLRYAIEKFDREKREYYLKNLIK